MIRFFLSRLLQGILVIYVVLIITFFLQKLSPVSPFNGERNMPEEVRARQEAQWGYDKPWGEQLRRFLWSYTTFHPPQSMKLLGRGVGEIIAAAFPISVSIAVPALLIALILGIPLGAFAALSPGSLEDRVLTTAATMGLCMPSFVLAPLLGLFFGLKLGWFNVSGWEDASDWVLPAVTLGFIYSGYIARLTKGSLRETLAQEFIRTARAKGAGETAVVLRHAMKLACLPVLNFLGPTAAGLFTGSFIVETVFQIPGLGLHFVNSALHDDQSLAAGITAFYAAIIVAFNLLVDVIQAALNPRIKLES